MRYIRDKTSNELKYLKEILPSVNRIESKEGRETLKVHHLLNQSGFQENPTFERAKET